MTDSMNLTSEKVDCTTKHDFAVLQFWSVLLLDFCKAFEKVLKVTYICAIYGI